MPTLLARLSAVDPDKGTAVVRFELVNEGDSDLYVLKRGTPLEGLLTDCLVVQADGSERALYDGVLLVRGSAVQSEYVCLKAGGRVYNDVDLSETYRLTASGRYMVSFARPVVCLTAPSPADGGGQAIELVECQAEAGLYVGQSVVGRDTVGERIRRDFATTPAEVDAPRILAARPPAFRGTFTPARRGLLTAAHTDAYDKGVAAARDITNDATYRKWFGAHTPERLRSVKRTFESIKSTMENNSFTYNNESSDSQCREGVMAWTTFENPQIFICDLFWTLPSGGLSMGGTLLHEFAHIVNREVIDHTGVDSSTCEGLARDRPDLAVKNGPSYQLYVGG